jgi:methionyl-tRNA synthetase
VILVRKVEDETVQEELQRLTGGSAETAGTDAVAVEIKPEISIDDVMRLDLRVATVLAAERVKKSDKLLKLKIRIGNLERQIVAGIGRRYGPEDILGRRIVVVANLKPAKLMGQESQGMLLAANSDGADPVLVGLFDESAAADGWVVR